MQSSKALSIKPADIIVIVALLWVVGGTYFIAFRLANGLHDKMTTLHKDQAQETALRVKEKNLSELATAFSEHQTELDRLKVAYPNEEQAAEAMIEIQTMAAQAGVTVSSLTPSHGSADALPVAVAVTGSYQNINSFLHGLYANLRPVVVQNVSIAGGATDTTGAPAANSSSNLTATVSLSLSYNSSATSTAAPTATVNSK